ncbi:MAG: HEPN domain-containing protein [Kiritimatiellae bacterium]|nr:HEPN domain-containing protein [Kiritimatiellia bacterium]
MKQITKEWLRKALEDLEAIDCLLREEHLTNVIAFHAEQAVEKCFKAVVEEFGLGLVKTHDLI